MILILILQWKVRGGGKLKVFLTDQNLQSVTAAIAQLGERKTEDLEVAGSIPARGTS